MAQTWAYVMENRDLLILHAEALSAASVGRLRGASMASKRTGGKQIVSASNLPFRHLGTD